MKKIVLLIFLIVGLLSVEAQINRFDTEGKRHGVWKKTFKNGNTRYIGKFDHGKEVGVFKFYSLASLYPVIIKTFDGDKAFTEFYKSGRLLSEGYMQGKKRIGKWVYYQSDGQTIMQEEFYVNGKLEGESITYFKNKKPTIIAHYKNGKLNGSYKRYSAKNNIYQDLNYKDDKLDGSAIYYNRMNGTLLEKGQFKDDLKVGVWSFFHNGKPSGTKDYSKRLIKK